MANFKTHITIATISSALMSEVLLSMAILSPREALLLFGLGVIGGITPDIDSDNSTSAQLLFNIISVSITTLWIFMMAYHYSFVEMILISVFSFVVIRFGFMSIISFVSVHRGMIHSIPVAVTIGLALTSTLHYFFLLNEFFSWLLGVVFALNYLIHLLTDELFSIDIGNRKIKKSFGTAFKLFRFKSLSDKIYTLIIYLILSILYYVAPSNELFFDIFSSKETWIEFKANLLPNDDIWFNL